jgi:site-specific DNA recombinase
LSQGPSNPPARAHKLFQRQDSREKRRLLNFLLSNCTWKNGELEVTYRQPFDMIVEMHREDEKKKAACLPKSDLFDNWLPVLDEFRNFLASGEGAIVSP